MFSLGFLFTGFLSFFPFSLSSLGCHLKNWRRGILFWYFLYFIFLFSSLENACSYLALCGGIWGIILEGSIRRTEGGWGTALEEMVKFGNQARGNGPEAEMDGQLG